jgi:hypothetical protein
LEIVDWRLKVENPPEAGCLQSPIFNFQSTISNKSAPSQDRLLRSYGWIFGVCLVLGACDVKLLKSFVLGALVGLEL